MFDAGQGSVVHALLLEHGGEIFAARGIHQTVAGQFRQRVDARAAGDKDIRGGVLEDHAQHDRLLLSGLRQNHSARANAKIGLARAYIDDCIDEGTALPDFNVKPGVPVKALLQRDVISRELKLMQPF